ncbi:MAG TPA: hypothetical protein VNU71_13325 [Burkholderiaceae bacterium]|nr:hypothetical protein [Burkholderiaceae bacterium]
MNRDAWLDRDSGFQTPRPPFIVGKHSLKPSVLSTPPAPLAWRIVDGICAVVFVGTVVMTLSAPARAALLAFVRSVL